MTDRGHDHAGVLVNACRLTLHAALDRAAAIRGDHPLVRTDDRCLSYAEVQASSERLALALRSLGAQAQTAVVLLSHDAIASTVTWFAASRLGCPLVALNPALGADVLASTLRGLQPSVAVADSDLVALVYDILAGGQTIRGVVVAGSRPEVVAVSGTTLKVFSLEAVLSDVADRRADVDPPVAWDRPALVLGTSGSTGAPKRAVLSHGYCLHTAAEFASARGVVGDDVLYSPLPLFHINALTTTLLAALVSGATSAHDPTFSARTFWARTRYFNAKHVSLIGSMVPRLQALPDDGEDNPVKTILTSPARPELTSSFMARFDVGLVFAYGQTEATPVIGPDWAAHLPPGSTGRANRFFDVQLWDDTAAVVPPGAVGEIVYRPRSDGVVYDGYWNEPARTASRLVDGWFTSGDLARTVDGDCYVYVGRKDDIIRRAGENVSAVEVEAVVLGVPGVTEAAAHAVAGPLDTEIKVWVVCAPDAPVSATDVVAATRSLPPFARPRYLEFAASLPRTASDHLRRSELAALGLTSSTIDLQSQPRQR